MDDAFTVDCDVRYRDLDTLGHVNNAVYATYLEEARSAYASAVLGLDAADPESVVATLELSFERPVTMDDSVTVAVETTAVGETSARLQYEVRADGERAATGETTLVFVDPESKRPRPVPEDVRARVREHEGIDA